MKLTNKTVEEVIKQAVGEDALPLVRVLKNRKNVSEFKIADSMKRQINETRNMLYRLYHINLVNFTRKKDKKKGWYIYYWTFNMKRVKYLMSDLKKKRLDKLNDIVKREEGEHFFSCNSKCVRLDFEQATEFGYKCPECGALLNQEENSERLANAKDEIRKITSELKEKNKE